MVFPLAAVLEHYVLHFMKLMPSFAIFFFFDCSVVSYKGHRGPLTETFKENVLQIIQQKPINVAMYSLHKS